MRKVCEANERSEASIPTVSTKKLERLRIKPQSFSFATFTLVQLNINRIRQIEIEKIYLPFFIYIHSQSFMNVTYSNGWLFSF